MSDDEVQRQARSFGGVADAYDRGRPGYPAAAAAWLTGDEPLTVLELGAGTGKLTEQLVALGHDVHATDPDEAMLEILRTHLPDVRTSVCGAEEIAAADSSYDVVVAAQSFHWFDHDLALPEIRRVLKPRGRLSMVWNLRDERIPWIKKLGRVIGTEEQLVDPTELLQSSLRFIVVEQKTFKHWQIVDRRSIQDLVASRSNIAVLDDNARAMKMRELLELYDSYGRGMDGMQLHYETRCFRSRVVKSPVPDPSPSTNVDKPTDGEIPTSPPRDDDDGTLLIDFR
ncbi:MAG: methyltransferase domain-containing protein [Actinomycetota bacterium]|nr:methyltransferase domain-containing protein [Actinomycetota bacterium]